MSFVYRGSEDYPAFKNFAAFMDMLDWLYAPQKLSVKLWPRWFAKWRPVETVVWDIGLMKN